MRIECLDYFISVATYLNFTKAAKQHHIAQTAMSKVIMNIERELGVVLFERDNRNVRLTAAGKQFYDDACKIIEQYNQALQNIDDLKKGVKGNVRIGIGIYETVFVSEVLFGFHKHYPGIHVEVNQYTYDDLFDEITCDGLDIVFMNSLFCHVKNKIVPDTVKLIKLFDFNYCCVVHTSNPLVNHDVIRTEDLAKSVLLLFDNGEESNNALLKFADIHPREVLLFNSLNSMISLVEGNYGICFIPQFMKNSMPSDVKLIPQNFIPASQYYALCEKQIKNSSVDYYMQTIKDSKKIFKKFGY